MPRRVSLPTADDLFRPTSEPAVRAVPDAPEQIVAPEAPKGPSGRVKHDEKITVYVTAAELLELEQARLVLRGQFGIPVDRGRLVREALHIVLAGLESEGEDSALVRRLRE
ncbi:hypothetical protein ACFQ0K_15465 [Nocardioides caeni]|uniref:Cobyrinic acid a,c-diamide synthase n=1 Tax=Nocardioides caeni TaxID=574700 RepID=A0A4S8N235_9ACTN|nr:hypothetical protein [Nocardioides caeni]THV09461.1 hypothetical protein E9934_16135 [Nocardioides caeni]